jgi:hypothetical protein
VFFGGRKREHANPHLTEFAYALLDVNAGVVANSRAEFVQLRNDLQKDTVGKKGAKSIFGGGSLFYYFRNNSRLDNGDLGFRVW